MPYLIDANCFIQPANDYYGFDFCPGYWDWLLQQNGKGVVYSIDMIQAEVLGKKGALADWVKQEGANLFLPMDNAALSIAGQITNWVNTAAFKPQAIPKFMGGADPFLIAYAMAYGYTVVTHEAHDPNMKKRIQIPAVCNHFGIQCIRVSECLRATGATLVLS